jgi:phenylalanine-4-hydroxylase
MFGLKQNYSEYNDENKLVWSLLYKKQADNLNKKAAKDFLIGMQKMEFEPEKIPRFSHINAVLKATTGWKIEVVPGLIPDKDFFHLLSEKKFPSSTWLRHLNELEYLEEPDMFHDTFAHMPILTVQFFVDYLQELSKIALKHIENPLTVELVGRLYWFTVEFGLIQEPTGLRIYGAGILSSSAETDFCLSEKANRKPLNIREILENPYYKDHFQDRYYVINSYEELFKSLPEIDRLIEKAFILNKPPYGDITKFVCKMR